jgi:integrase/recombinase XerD
MKQMNSKSPIFQTLLQNFFLQRMMQQRKVSDETINSYRDTFRIYIKYMMDVHGISTINISVEHFDMKYIQLFCEYLEKIRGNKSVTINNRIAAIRSFMKYVSEVAPEYSGIAKRASLVPMQKHQSATIDFITKAEFETMLKCCNIDSSIGTRDKLMLLLLYNTGIRVSELLSLKCCDINNLSMREHSSLKITGKGRKERTVPLWKNTSIYVQKYIKTNRFNYTDNLFINKNGDKLTRSGVRSRISVIVNEAATDAPTLSEKNITPHTFRHSVAMNLLAAGVDISTIAIWLGHSSLETTHKYMVADMELKRKAMEKAGQVGNSTYNYKPSADILSFLDSL